MSRHFAVSERFVHLLAKSNPRQRKVLLKNATSTELRSLFEVCLNIIRGNLPLRPADIERLKRHRTTIETLSDRCVPPYKKKRLINQRGGIFGQIAAIALQLLTQVIGSVLSSRKK